MSNIYPDVAYVIQIPAPTASGRPGRNWPKWNPSDPMEGWMDAPHQTYATLDEASAAILRIVGHARIVKVENRSRTVI